MLPIWKSLANNICQLYPLMSWRCSLFRKPPCFKLVHWLPAPVYQLVPHSKWSLSYGKWCPFTLSLTAPARKHTTQSCCQWSCCCYQSDGNSWSNCRSRIAWLEWPVPIVDYLLAVGLPPLDFKTPADWEGGGESLERAWLREQRDLRKI